MILCLCPNPSIDSYAWLDSFDSGGVNRIGKLREYPGGKGVHVALAIAELGGEAKLMGVWGGNTGEWIKEESRKRNVDSCGITVSENNRKCYTFRSERSDFNNSELLEPEPSLSKENWNEFSSLFKKEIDGKSMICMSGSWSADSPQDAYAQLITAAHKKSVDVILDCTGPQLEKALEVGFFGLHLNQAEAEKLCGSGDIHKLLERIGDKVQLVALTKGKDGLLLSYKGQLLAVNVEIDHVISTVGSGDCLTAGLAFALSRKLSVEDIAAYGVACGAANCLTEALGLLENDVVQHLLPKVNITNLTDEN